MTARLPTMQPAALRKLRRVAVRTLAIAGICAGLGACAALSGEQPLPGIGHLLSDEGRNPDSKLGNYLAARYATNIRDREAAAAYFSRVLEKDPDNTAILARAFLLQIASGDLESANGLADRVVAIEPADRTARLLRGLDELKHARYAEARAEFGAAAPGPFTRLVTGLLTAWAWVGEGNTDAALEALALDEEGAGHELFATYHRALIAELAGRNELAAEEYQKAMQASGGGSVRIVQAYGRFLERMGQGDEAMVIYSAFLTMSPDHPLILDALSQARDGKPRPPLVATARQGASEALYGLGSALSRDQGLDVSVLYLRLALFAYEDMDVARVLLAELLNSAGEVEEAAHEYAAVPASSPLAPTARIEAALLADRLGRGEEAVSMLEALVRRRPGDIEAIIALGDLLRGRDEYARAEEYYARAIDLLPETLSRHWSMFYARGVVRERQGKWEQAEADFFRALELEPDQPYVLNYLGYSWVEKHHKLDEALAMIERAVEQRPNDGFIVDSLGWANYRLGRYEEAVVYLERAVELDPYDPTINDHLGDALWKVGRRVEARFQWQHALDAEPEDEALAARIREKIDSGLDVVEAAEAEHARGNEGS